MKTKRRKKIILIVLGFIFGLALGAAGYVVYKQYFAREKLELPSFFGQKSPEPLTIANPLDGTKVDPSFANRHPLGIIIENHPAARPQIGLDKASIIYEAITEGGITRYLAIYGPREQDKVGPVRSLRTFFLDWAWEYNAFLAHVGGNIDALDRLSPENVLDLDQFALGEKAYWREPQAGKTTEHTMFSSTSKLYQAANDKKWDMMADFTALEFLDPKKFIIKQETRQKITIDFSSPSYEVVYEYDPINNNYLRALGGGPHKDRQTGNQLSPTNIIIQEVIRREGTTRINENSWTMETIGEGKAYVIYGGQKIEAAWKKTDLKARTKFYDSAGKEISFLPGQFWYEIVPPEVFSQIKVESGENPG